MQAVAIVLLCIVSAIVYGILHDQITARVCVEYFTIGHPPVLSTENPTLLGLGWGVIATWWVGLGLGIPLAVCARIGAWPKVQARELVRPLCITLSVMGLLALGAGVVTYFAIRHRTDLRSLVPPRLPEDRTVPFLVDGAAQLMSYFSGFVGGIFLCVSTLLRRARSRHDRDS